MQTRRRDTSWRSRSHLIGVLCCVVLCCVIGVRSVQGTSLMIAIIALTSMACMNWLLRCLEVMEYHIKLESPAPPQPVAAATAVDPAAPPPPVVKNAKRKVILFGDVASYAFGARGKTVLNVALIVTQIGCCIAYVSFISENMHTVYSGLTRIEWIWVLFPFLCVLTQLRKIKYVAAPSGAGNFVYAFAIGSVFYFGFSSSWYVCTQSSADLIHTRGGSSHDIT